MPTIDLYDEIAHADGWHDVRAPGGYEWWYFDAEDAATDTQVVAIFMQGFIFHPGYLRAFARYLRRPTTALPPTGADYPCVYLCAYRGGKIWRQFFTQYRREQFRAARDRCDVHLGDNCWARETDDGYEIYLLGSPWTLTARGPVTSAEEVLSAKLRFRRSPFAAPPRERAFLSRAMTGAAHRWSIVAPSCAVEGTIRITRSAISGGGSDVMAFHGRGYHDHNFGTAPVGDGLARWTWGRAMFAGGRTVTFHHAEPTDTTRADETHVVEVSADGAIVDHAVPKVVGDWSRVCRPAMFLRYPATLDFGDVLRLSSPRVVDPSPFYLRLQFEAESRGERATAFCELAYPHRLRWPILGRMIEMSFDKRALRRR